MNRKLGTAIVVGAGISGIRSALDLAESGYGVTLIDKAPHMGGILSQLDYQFPTDRCGMCKMLPLVNRDSSSQYCLRKGLFHENIDIQLSTELIAVDGGPGSFQITLRKEPAWVNQDLCMGCGECVAVCPVEISDTFNLNLNKRKAVYLPVPHNIPNTYTIDQEQCTKCGDCINVCPTNAISIPEQQPEPLETEMVVGAIVLSSGTGYHDPAQGKDTYGYSQYPDVVTSREFERLLSGSGPNNGQLLKPSNGQPVKKIAWFQCVGSRDSQTNSDFCSSVCCMHSIKEARLLKERAGDDVEATIFYMDMRTFGKSFQRYRDESEEKHQIRFERSRVHSVTRPPDQEDGLNVVYVSQDGSQNEEIYDMVVLAVGQKPSDGVDNLLEASGIQTDQWGFCQENAFIPALTGVEGIVSSGSFSGLKDISESVIQAGSASLEASRVLHAAGGSLKAEENISNPYRDVSKDRPYIMAVVCDCGETMSNSLDRDSLKRELDMDFDVKQVVFIEKLCTEAGWLELAESAADNRINRILIGACMPHVYERKIKELSLKIELDPILIEVVDIYNSSCSTPVSAMKSGIARLRGKNPVAVESTPIEQKALVAGAGISGMTAALAIADHGFDVELIEQNSEPGGNLKWLQRTLDGNETEGLLKETVSAVENHPQINLRTDSTVLETLGQVGQFRSMVKNGNEVEIVAHGVTILASGGSEAQTTAFSYENSGRVISQKDLDKKFKNRSINPADLNSVVMIQCVESREEPRNYCSRVCCSTALKNALHLKEENPEISVYVFYRDMMSYGGSETYYTKARKAGVVFIPFDKNRKPEVEASDHSVVIKAYEPNIGRDLEIEADLLVLATGINPNFPENMGNGLGIEADSDGFFQEADSKWRPVDSIKEGVFACGIVHSPRNLRESIASAEAAAQRALKLMSGKEVYAGSVTAEVRHSLCSLCEKCIATCPYEARSIVDEERVVVNALMCQGCGSCATVCPNSASIVRQFQDQQLFEEIDAAVSGL